MKELAGIAALLILAIGSTGMPRSYADPPPGLDDLYAVEVAGKHYWLRYSITGGSVESIIAKEDTATVTVMIQALQDGHLEIYLPGSFLSSFQNPPLSFSELDAIIFIDELEATGEILQRGCDFAVRIPFEAGSEQIDIVGTFLIGSEPTGAEPALTGQYINVRFPVKNREIQLGVITNADTCDFSFDQNEKRFHAELTGPMREEGHFQVTLPHEYLGGPYTVLVNEQPVDFESVFSNATIRHTTTISLQYEGGPASIDIIGTTAIPEFAAVIGIVAVSIGAIALLVRFSKLQKVL
ncbi:hypothetical protein [Nitrososphaera sp.]|uniref:hypothetical protein n=1 Tax=Nitrososphaera sp. TaxID=1971748 RepID=UPI0031718FAF